LVKKSNDEASSLVNGLDAQVERSSAGFEGVAYFGRSVFRKGCLMRSQSTLRQIGSSFSAVLIADTFNELAIFNNKIRGLGIRPVSPQGEIMSIEKRKTKFTQVLQITFLTKTQGFNSKKARCK
jgi:hypothetical protein